MNHCYSLVTDETPRHNTEHTSRRKGLTVVFVLKVRPMEKTLVFFPVCGMVSWPSAVSRITK